MAAEIRHFLGAVAQVAPVAPDIGQGPQHATYASYWRDLFEERAAIRQFDAGYSKATAERLAWGEVVEAWCDRHPLPIDVVGCAGCGKPLGHDVLDLPDGAVVHFEPEREFACLIAYGHARKRRAVAALAALGLPAPTGWGT